MPIYLIHLIPHELWKGPQSGQVLLVDLSQCQPTGEQHIQAGLSKQRFMHWVDAGRELSENDRYHNAFDHVMDLLKHSMLFRLWKPLPATGKKGGLFDTKSLQTVSWKMHKLTNPSCWNLAKPLYNKTNCYSQCLKTRITVITNQKNNTDNHKLQVPNFPKSWGSKNFYIDANAVTSPLANTILYIYIHILYIYIYIHMANIWHFACFVAWSLQWEAGIWILFKGFWLQSGSDGLSLVPQKVSRKAASTRKAYVTSSRNIDKLQGQHMSNEEKNGITFHWILVALL